MACISKCTLTAGTVTCVTPTTASSFPPMLPLCPIANFGMTIANPCIKHPSSASLMTANNNSMHFSWQQYPGLFTTLFWEASFTITGNMGHIHVSDQWYDSYDTNFPMLNQLPDYFNHVVYNGLPQNSTNYLHFPQGATSIAGGVMIWGVCTDWNFYSTPYTPTDPNCTTTTTVPGAIQPEDTIIVFIDSGIQAEPLATGTGTAGSGGISYANDIVATIEMFMADNNLNNPVYYYRIGGERYLQWPIAFLQPGKLPQEYLFGEQHLNYASTAGPPTSGGSPHGPGTRSIPGGATWDSSFVMGQTGNSMEPMARPGFYDDGYGVSGKALHGVNWPNSVFGNKDFPPANGESIVQTFNTRNPGIDHWCWRWNATNNIDVAARYNNSLGNVSKQLKMLDPDDIHPHTGLKHGVNHDGYGPYENIICLVFLEEAWSGTYYGDGPNTSPTKDKGFCNSYATPERLLTPFGKTQTGAINHWDHHFGSLYPQGFISDWPWNNPTEEYIDYRGITVDPITDARGNPNRWADSMQGALPYPLGAGCASNIPAGSSLVPCGWQHNNPYNASGMHQPNTIQTAAMGMWGTNGGVPQPGAYWGVTPLCREAALGGLARQVGACPALGYWAATNGAGWSLHCNNASTTVEWARCMSGVGKGPSCWLDHDFIEYAKACDPSAADSYYAWKATIRENNIRSWFMAEGEYYGQDMGGNWQGSSGNPPVLNNPLYPDRHDKDNVPGGILGHDGYFSTRSRQGYGPGLGIIGEGLGHKSGMKQHLGRMFGGGKLSDCTDQTGQAISSTIRRNLNSIFDDPNNFHGHNPTFKSDWNLYQDLGGLTWRRHDRYLTDIEWGAVGGGGGAYCPSVTVTLGSNSVSSYSWNGAPDVDSFYPNDAVNPTFCNLPYWADKIATNAAMVTPVTADQDFSLLNYNWSLLTYGRQEDLWSVPYDDGGGYNVNPPTSNTWTRLDGGPLTSTEWPNSLYYRLYTKLLETTTGAPGCHPPCDKYCRLFIKAYQDNDQDCTQDAFGTSPNTTGPSGPEVDVSIDIEFIDTNGTVKWVNIPVGGVWQNNLPIGTYYIEGKALILDVPCMEYEVHLPVFVQRVPHPGGVGCTSGCMDPTGGYTNYDPTAIADCLGNIPAAGTYGDTSCCEKAGCTNPCSYNYDSTATINDGSCCPCTLMDYIIDPSALCCEHKITMKVEWPLTHAQQNAGANSVGLGNSGAFGLPVTVWEEEFIYYPTAPATCVMPAGYTSCPAGVYRQSDGSYMGYNHFQPMTVDASGNPNYTFQNLDPSYCGLGMDCWQLIFEVESDSAQLDPQQTPNPYDLIQVGSYEFSNTHNTLKYIYVPHDEGIVYMGNVFGGAPIPPFILANPSAPGWTAIDMNNWRDAVATNITNYWATHGIPQVGGSSIALGSTNTGAWATGNYYSMSQNPFLMTPDIFMGSFAYAVNYWQVNIKLGIQWSYYVGNTIGMGGGNVCDIGFMKNFGTPITSIPPALLGGLFPGSGPNTWNYTSNACGDLGGGCPDPDASNFVPAAQGYSGAQWLGMYQQNNLYMQCVYDCRDITVEMYILTVRKADGTHQSGGAHNGSSSWTWVPVSRDDNALPGSGNTPNMGYYNGIPIKEIDLGDMASDVRWRLKTLNGTVIYTSEPLKHPKATEGGFRVGWLCYPDPATANPNLPIDYGAAAGFQDGENMNQIYQTGGTQWYNPNLVNTLDTTNPASGASITTTQVNTTIGAGNSIYGGLAIIQEDYPPLYDGFKCGAVACVEDGCLIFEKMGSYERGWESWGVIVKVWEKNHAGMHLSSGGPTPISGGGLAVDHSCQLCRGRYHIPPGMYQLNLSKQGGDAQANSVWATNWAGSEIELTFGVNPVETLLYQPTGGSTPINGGWNQTGWYQASSLNITNQAGFPTGGVNLAFVKQYWGLWNCSLGGGPTPPYSQVAAKCANPLNDEYDIYAGAKDAALTSNCAPSRTYSVYTTLNVVVTTGIHGMLGRKVYPVDEATMEETEGQRGKKPYDTGTRGMTTEQHNKATKIARPESVDCFFEFVIKREPKEEEPYLKDSKGRTGDGAKTHMEFARILEHNVQPNKVYKYTCIVPYGEDINFNIIDNFGSDLNYEIQQVGDRLDAGDFGSTVEISK